MHIIINWYFILLIIKILLDKIDIQSDMKITVKGSGVKFYFWINQWYSTLDLIKTHVDQSKQVDNNYFYISTKDIESKKKKMAIEECKGCSDDNLEEINKTKSSEHDHVEHSSLVTSHKDKNSIKKVKTTFDLEMTVKSDEVDDKKKKSKYDL